MTLLKKLFASSYFIFLFLSLARFSPAYAQTWEDACVGGPDKDVATIQGIGCVIINLTQFFVPLILIAAVLMIIYAGAQIIAGADNPKAVAQGKQTLLFAIIGVIGIAAAWFILVLIETFTGAPVTILNFGVSPGIGAN